MANISPTPVQQYLDESGAVLWTLDNAGNATAAGTITTGGLNTGTAANALTAHAGGGQGSALALTASINRVTTVATAADSVKLPAALAGQSIVVINAAAANS